MSRNEPCFCGSGKKIQDDAVVLYKNKINKIKLLMIFQLNMIKSFIFKNFD